MRMKLNVVQIKAFADAFKENISDEKCAVEAARQSRANK